MSSHGIPEFRGMDSRRGDLRPKPSVPVLVDPHARAVLSAQTELPCLFLRPFIEGGEVPALFIGQVQFHVEAGCLAVDIAIRARPKGGQHGSVDRTELEVWAWFAVSKDGRRFLPPRAGLQFADSLFGEVDLAQKWEGHVCFFLLLFFLGLGMNAFGRTRLGSCQNRNATKTFTAAPTRTTKWAHSEYLHRREQHL